jgi:hypothetical protein
MSVVLFALELDSFPLLLWIFVNLRFRVVEKKTITSVCRKGE